MRRRIPHAQIHLPPLSGEEAYLLVRILERAVTAIWRAHGDQMADFQGRAFPDAPRPPDAIDGSEQLVLIDIDDDIIF